MNMDVWKRFRRKLFIIVFLFFFGMGFGFMAILLQVRGGDYPCRVSLRYTIPTPNCWNGEKGRIYPVFIFPFSLITGAK